LGKIEANVVGFDDGCGDTEFRRGKESGGSETDLCCVVSLYFQK